jgi:hypothetical protein
LEPPHLTAEGTVGAVLSIVHARVLARDPASLIGLLNPLIGIIVLPYLGAAAARRELTRPVPARRRSRAPHRDLLDGLAMRLTYRTVRVLTIRATRTDVPSEATSSFLNPSSTGGARPCP